jgi:hypothetical protein
MSKTLGGMLTWALVLLRALCDVDRRTSGDTKVS